VNAAAPGLPEKIRRRGFLIFRGQDADRRKGNPAALEALRAGPPIACLGEALGQVYVQK